MFKVRKKRVRNMAVYGYDATSHSRPSMGKTLLAIWDWRHGLIAKLMLVVMVIGGALFYQHLTAKPTSTDARSWTGNGNQSVTIEGNNSPTTQQFTQFGMVTETLSPAAAAMFSESKITGKNVVYLNVEEGGVYKTRISVMVDNPPSPPGLAFTVRSPAFQNSVTYELGEAGKMSKGGQSVNYQQYIFTFSTPEKADENDFDISISQKLRL